jgi:hypothetical protein
LLLQRDPQKKKNNTKALLLLHLDPDLAGELDAPVARRCLCSASLGYRSQLHGSREVADEPTPKS